MSTPYVHASPATLARLSHATGLAVARAWSHGTASFDFVTYEHVHGTWDTATSSHVLHPVDPGEAEAHCHVSCPPPHAVVDPLPASRAGEVDPLRAQLAPTAAPGPRTTDHTGAPLSSTVRRRMCTGKRRFRDKIAASLALARVDAGRRGPRADHEPCRAYRCPVCSGYHLTSRPA